VNRTIVRAAVVLGFVAIPLLIVTIGLELRADQPTDTYWQTDGPEYHPIDRAAFNRAVRSGICVTLHAKTWPDRETQHVCDL
jgi:hypothetical protein